MNAQEVSDRIDGIVLDILTPEGFELVEVQFRREARGWVLRLYVDKQRGITLDDCAWISQEVGRRLDVEDFIEIPYTLEVSSPGLNRRLKTVDDFRRYCSRRIRVITNQPIGNRRQFNGKLCGIDGDQIQIEAEGSLHRIPLSAVAKANLEIEF